MNKPLQNILNRLKAEAQRKGTYNGKPHLPKKDQLFWSLSLSREEMDSLIEHLEITEPTI